MTARSAQLAPVAPAGMGWQWLQPAAEMAALLSGYWPVDPYGASQTRPGSALGESGRPAAGIRGGPPGTGWTATPLVATRTPPAVAHSVTEARTFTLRTLQRWGATDCTDEVVAVVSELLTNALRHALPEPGARGSIGSIRLGLLHPGPCVLCAVADPSNQVPVPRHPDWDAETGRGLQVVSSLSHRWGYCPAPDPGGKVVWATVLTSSGLR
jgi:hypothetical protein